MIFQKFVFPCYYRTTHKNYRPGNRENQPTQNFIINENILSQYMKNLHPRKFIHANINLAKIDLREN